MRLFKRHNGKPKPQTGKTGPTPPLPVRPPARRHLTRDARIRQTLKEITASANRTEASAKAISAMVESMMSDRPTTPYNKAAPIEPIMPEERRRSIERTRYSRYHH